LLIHILNFEASYNGEQPLSNSLLEQPGMLDEKQEKAVTGL